MHSRQYRSLPRSGHGHNQAVDPHAQVVGIVSGFSPTLFPNETALPLYLIPLLTLYL